MTYKIKGIERITTEHLVVGIDIAKETHVAKEEARRELKRLLEEYERLSSLLDEIEQEVLALLKEIPDVVELLQSIKGLSPLLIAAILAGTGDLGKYADGRQVLSHANERCINSIGKCFHFYTFFRFRLGSI